MPRVVSQKRFVRGIDPDVDEFRGFRIMKYPYRTFENIGCRKAEKECS